MSALLDSLDSRDANGSVNVVIDTPSGSAAKFKYDDRLGCYRLSRLLPKGAVFPYNFGSIPRTAAEDGDPLDVLVLTDVPMFVGCLVKVRLIGVIQAMQRDSDKSIRNDRLLGAPVTEVNPAAFDHIDQLGPVRVGEIEHFFASYNRAHGREFTPDGRGGPEAAERALRSAKARYARGHRSGGTD